MELNKQQKEAIEHDKGPALVIAGAGTGKTRVITSRITHLIKSGRAKPSEVLALTFTEKAANEMTERVDEGMPFSYEEITIKTFHSFSDQVLRESGLEMGIDPGYKILTQLEQWFFFRKHLFDFDLDYYRPLGNPNSFVYGLLGHFGKLKDERISPERYMEYARGIEDEEGFKMQELARVYGQYQDLLIKNNSLDFGDLTYYALELFEKRSSVLKKYQEQYKYILVDEFQDTNHAQFQLILKLASAHNNLFVVGDDDQSIYKWRGASLSNILQFGEHFPGARNIVLTENYRSAQAVLECAYSLILNNNPDRLEEKLGISKKLSCNRSGADKVEVHHFNNYGTETNFVVEKIMELAKGGMDLGEMAVLVRSNMHAYPFVNEMKLRGVPYQVRNPKGLLSRDVVKDLVAVIKFLGDPADDVAATRILKVAVFDIAMKEILQLLNNLKKQSIFECLAAVSEQDEQVLPGLESGTTKAFTLLNTLIEYSKDNSVGLVLNHFLQESGYLGDLVKREAFEDLDAINEFAKQVSKFERNNDGASVVDFLNYLNLLEEANSSLPSDELPDQNAVQILTVHSSKGLEFDAVFVVNAVKQRFPTTNRKEQFELPTELANEIYSEGDFHLQEERRLFYVAVTRAKQRLFVTYSDKYEGNKAWKKSPFVDEILSNGFSESFEHHEQLDPLRQLSDKKQRVEKEVKELAEFNRKRLSYSQFSTFQSCPLKYNYRYLTKVPSPQSHAANFGSSVHNALNEFYYCLKRGESVSLDLLKRLYEKHWVGFGYISREHLEARKQKGWKILENFYRDNSDPWIVPKYLERPFNLKVGDYWVNGRIDRIDKLEDGTYEVIDYKTGKLRSSLNVKKDLQLSVYAMACRDVLKIPVSKLTLYYLEDRQKVSTSRNDAEIDEMYLSLEEIIKDMEKSDFSPTPGFHCQFCEYRLICPAI